METLLFIISAVALVMTGLFGILTRRNIVKILLAVNILETGINLLVVALGYFAGGAVPIISGPVDASRLAFVDPLPHALVLTSIVIGLGTTALALTMTLNYFRNHGSLEFASQPEIEGEVKE